jgi:hypothetical protein
VERLRSAPDFKADWPVADEGEIGNVKQRMTWLSFPNRAPERVIRDGNQPIDETLSFMAAEYLDANRLSDHNVRTARKTQIARAMGLYCIERGISHDQLASSSEPGIQVALANAVRMAAWADDVDRLITMGPNVNRLHVQYAMALAFQELAKAGCISPVQRAQIEGILDSYYNGGDGPLKAVIKSTLGILGANAG